MSTRRRSPRLAGAGSLIALQVVCCIILGVAMMTSSSVGLAGLVGWLGVYWLWRAIGTVSHTLLVAPDQWASRGMIVVTNLAAAVMALQAPLLDLFGVGPAVVLFIGFQATAAGALELVFADHHSAYPLAFLALVNLGLGTTLAAVAVGATGLAVSLVGWAIFVAGFMALYLLLALPRPRLRRPDRRLEP